MPRLAQLVEHLAVVGKIQTSQQTPGCPQFKSGSGDQLISMSHNCVSDANSDQADSDGNGIGDACESAASSGDEDDGGDDKPTEDSSNKTLAYAALLAVALVGILVIFGRENDK